jgi:hypothetical protein
MMASDQGNRPVGTSYNLMFSFSATLLERGDPDVWVRGFSNNEREQKGKKNKQTERHTEGYTERHTEGYTERHTEGYTEIHT